MADRIDVMISSTSKDLQDHRDEAKEAVLRMGMFPLRMEDLRASNEDAISASLRLVDEAEIFVGIYAYRYGFQPDDLRNPDKLSITEMEYRRAVERDIPRLIFIIGDNHPVVGANIDKGADAVKLDAFKEEVKLNQIVRFFDSPADLRAELINSLIPFRPDEDTMRLERIETNNVPIPSQKYVAHPYTLLQTSQVINWAAKRTEFTDPMGHRPQQ